MGDISVKQFLLFAFATCLLNQIPALARTLPNSSLSDDPIAVARSSPPAPDACGATASKLPAQRFVDDLRAKRLDDILSLYTPDAVFVDPSGTHSGIDAIRALDEQVFAKYDSDLTLHREHLARIARKPLTCLDSGTWEENLHVRSTGVVNRNSGTYRFTYRQSDQGVWLISRQEWLLKPSAATPK